MVTDLKKKLARRLRQLRLDRGLTQDRLAERSQISTDAVRRLERGGFSPTLRLLEQLSRGLDLPLSELVSFRETKAPEGMDRIVAFLSGRKERELALVLRLAQAALAEPDD